MSERPRLSLKPRDPDAVAKAEAERAEKQRSSVFGSAKPREQTLATRTGKTEEEVLRDAIKSERLNLRLNYQQTEQKQALEAAAEDVKEQIKLESDEGTKAALAETLKEREAALDALMDTFAQEALESARRGDVQRPSERKAMQAAAGGDGPGGYGMPDHGYQGGGGRGGGWAGPGRGPYNEALPGMPAAGAAPEAATDYRSPFPAQDRY